MLLFGNYFAPFSHDQLDKLFVDNREQLVIFHKTKRVKYVRVTVAVSGVLQLMHVNFIVHKFTFAATK